MNNLKFGIFDIFTYLIPGGVIGLCLVIGFDNKVCDLQSINQALEKLPSDVSKSIVAIVAAYVLGIICQFFGTVLFYGIKKYGWKIPDQDFDGLTNAEFHVLLREHSPQNFAYVELYLAQRGMSHNMAFACLLCSALSAYKPIALECSRDEWIWWMGAIGLFIFALIFLDRAKMFHKWYYDDGIAAVKKLNLKDKTPESTNTQNTV